MHRSQICHVSGAFFNGVFLLALAFSILLQSIQRFIHVEPIQSPIVVLVVGAVGLTLNIISALVVHGEAVVNTMFFFNALHTDHGGHGHGDDTVAMAVREPVSSTLDIVRIPYFYASLEIHSCSSQHESHHHTIDPPVKAPQRNLNLVGVFIHLCGDAVNSMFLVFCVL